MAEKIIEGQQFSNEESEKISEPTSVLSRVGKIFGRIFEKY